MNWARRALETKPLKPMTVHPSDSLQLLETPAWTERHQVQAKETTGVRNKKGQDAGARASFSDMAEAGWVDWEVSEN